MLIFLVVGHILSKEIFTMTLYVTIDAYNLIVEGKKGKEALWHMRK